MVKISFKDDIDCDMETKEIKGSGLGKLPSSIERLLDKNKDRVISKITIFRLPLQKELTIALNALTDNSVKQFLKKNDIDKLYHLGVFLETNGGDFVYDKQANFSFVEAPKGFLKQPKIETSPVSNLPAGLTIGEMFDAGRKLMKSKFYYYSALKYNCQFFIQQSLDAIGASYDLNFVVQDLTNLVKRIPEWKRRFGILLTTVGREADKLISIGVDKAKDVRRGVKDTAKDVKKTTKKAVKKTKRFLGFGYSVAMKD
tara:strand:- start:618 stop:1388 length:771 start_codon:yes stop_codon:yes gene_type:complete